MTTHRQDTKTGLGAEPLEGFRVYAGAPTWGVRTHVCKNGRRALSTELGVRRRRGRRGDVGKPYPGGDPTVVLSRLPSGKEPEGDIQCLGSATPSSTSILLVRPARETYRDETSPRGSLSPNTGVQWTIDPGPFTVRRGTQVVTPGLPRQICRQPPFRPQS